MQKIIFLSLLSLCRLSQAMDLQHLQIGQTATWQEKAYVITNRIEQDPRLKLILMRDTHKACGATLVEEYVTCSYQNGKLEYSISRSKPSLLCMSTTLTAAICWTCLLFMTQ